MTDKRTRALAFIVSGVAVGILTGVLGWVDARSGVPRYSLALLVVLGLVAVGLLAAGLSELRVAKEAADGKEVEPADFRHTVPLFSVLGVGLLGALVARGVAVPDTFGTEGNYRADARLEAMSARPPRLQGKKTCVRCHEYQYELHEKDVHRTVECEVCHGPADVHVAKGKEGPIERRPTKDWCLTCHRQLTARPGAFPQVDWQEHYKFVGAQDEKVECIGCHDPHEPLFLQRPVRESRLHPLVHRCRDCHLGRMDEKVERPANHPAIFECSYCHQKIAEDFDTTPHYAEPCTTCHLFLRESDFAGRIMRNDDPRFCLLCHGEMEFRPTQQKKEEGVAPIIKWPDHMTAKDAAMKDDETPCTKCHAVQVHSHLEGARK